MTDTLSDLETNAYLLDGKDQPPDVIYPTLRDKVTSDLRSKIVPKAMLWAAKSHRPAHWRTSFPFAEVESDSAVGISFDMWMPKLHVNNFITNHSINNRYGSLAIRPRALGLLLSKYLLVLVEVPLVKGITAGDIIDLVTVQNKLQNYIYHPDESGCLFWQLTLLNCLCKRQWCSPGFEEILRDRVSQIQRQGNIYADAVVWPPVAGTFYSK